MSKNHCESIFDENNKITAGTYDIRTLWRKAQIVWRHGGESTDCMKTLWQIYWVYEDMQKVQSELRHCGKSTGCMHTLWQKYWLYADIVAKVLIVCRHCGKSIDCMQTLWQKYWLYADIVAKVLIVCRHCGKSIDCMQTLWQQYWLYADIVAKVLIIWRHCVKCTDCVRTLWQKYWLWALRRRLVFNLEEEEKYWCVIATCQKCLFWTLEQNARWVKTCSFPFIPLYHPWCAWCNAIQRYNSLE